MITQRIKVGNEWLEIEYNSDKDLIEKGQFWREVAKRTSCDCCQSTDISLNFRKPKGYSYYGLRCGSCGASVNFGQIKASGEFFLKWDSKFEKYQADEGKPDEETPTPENKIDPEDIPF